MIPVVGTRNPKIIGIFLDKGKIELKRKFLLLCEHSLSLAQNDMYRVIDDT